MDEQTGEKSVEIKHVVSKQLASRLEIKCNLQAIVGKFPYLTYFKLYTNTEIVAIRQMFVDKLRGCLHGGRKILALGRSEKAGKLFVCFTCRNFGRSGY